MAVPAVRDSMQPLVDRVIAQYNQQYAGAVTGVIPDDYVISEIGAPKSITLASKGIDVKIEFTEALGNYDSTIGEVYLNGIVPTISVLVGRRHWLELERDFALGPITLT